MMFCRDKQVGRPGRFWLLTVFGVLALIGLTAGCARVIKTPDASSSTLVPLAFVHLALPLQEVVMWT